MNPYVRVLTFLAGFWTGDHIWFQIKKSSLISRLFGEKHLCIYMIFSGVVVIFLSVYILQLRTWGN